MKESTFKFNGMTGHLNREVDGVKKNQKLQYLNILKLNDWDSQQNRDDRGKNHELKDV